LAAKDALPTGVGALSAKKVFLELFKVENGQ
jgi:hypothetical protein